MKLFRWIIKLVSLAILQSLLVDGQAGENILTEKDLRDMLKTVLEQNRRLVRQNTRMQQVWHGLELMCSAFNQRMCECPGSSQSPTVTTIPTTTISSTTVAPTELPTTTQASTTTKAPVLFGPGPLRLLNISTSSSVQQPGSVNVAVGYVASPQHTTEWIGLRKNGGMWRTSGKRVDNPTNEYTYFSRAEIGDIDTMRNLFFRLYNDEESVNVRLNISEILKNSTQVLPKPQRNYLKVQTKFKAPNETDLVIPAVLNQKAQQPDRFEFAEVFFTGLNTTSSPPAIFEIMHFNSDGINLAVSPLTETTSNLNITLRYPFARYGGILTVRMPYQEVIGGVIEEFYYGPFIKIVSSGEDSVVPPNTIGVFPIARQTLVIPPSQTVICAAMGNPRPEVSILKLGEGGTSVEIPSETVILDSTMNMIVHTFDASNPLTTEGRYFCRASNSFQTIDAPTEVIVLQPAVFDDRMTAVVQNSSDRIVISCQAKGKPKPQLKLKLYDEFGPDLVATGLYRIWKYGPEPDTSRVTLTLSPLEDAAITAVVCESNQGGAGGAFTNSRKIEVIPGKANFDMGLYNRLNDAVRL